MKKFSWGEVITRYQLPFEDGMLEIVKFHPWKTEGVSVLTGQPDYDQIQYHIEELRESFFEFDAAVIAWITYARLGLNQHQLVSGICKALDIY